MLVRCERELYQTLTIAWKNHRTNHQRRMLKQVLLYEEIQIYVTYNWWNSSHYLPRNKSGFIQSFTAIIIEFCVNATDSGLVRL